MIGFENIASAMDAYKFADYNGFIYSRSRIGYSIYKRQIDCYVLEIGKNSVMLYNAGNKNNKKSDRLLAKKTYYR